VNTNFILDGASGKDDIKKVDFQKSFSRKSDWGYVYSANNQPEAIDGFYIRIFARGSSKRITQLLDVGPIGIKSQ
jgi:penicillin amidase